MGEETAVLAAKATRRDHTHWERHEVGRKARG